MFAKISVFNNHIITNLIIISEYVYKSIRSKFHNLLFIHQERESEH